MTGKNMKRDIEKVKRKELNLRQESFCQAYCSSDGEIMGNGVYSYSKAYEIDITDPKKYMSVANSAHNLLKKSYIIERINEILEETGFTDQFADKQLGFLMAQHADFQTKLGAIKEFNKLKGRIVEKSMNLNINLPKPIYGGKSLQGHDGDSKDILPKKED